MNSKYPPGYFIQPALAWWPTFRSVCCDPNNESFVFRDAAKARFAELMKASDASRAKGVGFGNGTIPGIKRREA